MQANTLIAGDTFNPEPTVLPVYPASAGWVLKYRLVPRASSGTPIVLTCTASGANHQPQAAASVTKDWAPGEYAWTSWVERGSERYAIERGQLTILPDPATMGAGTDTRSQAQTALDAINAVLSNRATTDQLEFTIADRSLKRMSIDELLKLRSHYVSQVNQERGINRRILLGFR